MAEWDNPIFYLNFLGLVASILLLLRNRKSGMAWGMALVFAIGTGLHFVGDLFEADENMDHIFIHAVVMVALFVGYFQTRKSDA